MAPKAVNYVEKIPKQRGRCTSCICMSWKVFTCIVSHVMLISLVVGYCLLGAYAFEYLEGEHERNVKSGIKFIRGNLSHDLWIYTHEKIDYLREDEWTNNATKKLIDFENQILKTIKSDGWDGIEDPKLQQQWTRMGALFYSIIVITTIGYGHIAPKTDAGKITTIFYAIVGIPLMLLCLSNIGDIMASSFRFIYWRICCFVCTREPKRRPRRSEFQRSISQSQPRAISQTRFSNRASIRRSVRISQRTADSGIDSFHDPKMLHAYSDTDLRYIEGEMMSKRHSSRSQRFSRYRNRDRFRQERHTLERERVAERYSRRQNNDRNTLDRKLRPRSYNNQQSLRAFSMARGEERHHSRHMADEIVRDYSMTLPASHGRHRSRRNEMRAQSVDPRSLNSKRDAPVLRNKYAIDALLRQESFSSERHNRSKSMPRPHHRTKTLYSPSPEREPEAISERRSPKTIPTRLTASERSRFLAPPIAPDQCLDEEEFIELEVPVRRIKRKEKSILPPSPRIMSPMGFAVHRQARLQQFDEEAMYDDEWIDYPSELPIRPVPIWLCVFLVIGYIIGGAFYFNHSESWSFLDSAYFCFITLTTIGFGDFVPAQGLNASALREPSSWSMANISSTFHVTDQGIKIAGCSVYLLFGISLLAMSFNLVQEEVIANVKNVARQLGILKEEDSDYY